MTRTTGATDAQIAVAVFRVARPHYINDENTWRSIHQSHFHGPDNDLVTINHAASVLVDTDHRIVRVDDLRALVHAWLTEGRLPTETYDRIQAAIGEDE